MKTIKRAAVLVLSCALLLTAVACHQPNETVLTIGDVQIPSGLYLAMQMDSFSTFTSTVQSSLSSGETMSTISDVLKHSAEDKTSDQWIKDKTLEAAKLYAAVMTLWNEFGLSLTEEEEANLADWVDYYWSEDYQNMGSYYEPNGVSKETFAELMRNGTRQNKVFLYYYDKPDAEGKGGLETVPDADVIQGFSDNMVLVDNISIATTKTDSSGNSTSLTDDEKTAAKDKLQAYADRINNGKASFEDIYVEYNKELKEDFTAPEVTDKMSQKYPRRDGIQLGRQLHRELRSVQGAQGKGEFRLRQGLCGRGHQRLLPRRTARYHHRRILYRTGYLSPERAEHAQERRV